jgi:hypothetical protein
MTTIAETAAKPADDDLDKPVWGARNIGAEINKPTGATFHLLEAGLIDADKVGKQWVSTPRRLRKQFSGGSRLPQAQAK